MTAVTIKTQTGKSTMGNVDIETLTREQRMQRMFKALGISWGLAFCSVFVPVAHFILVPGFFIAGPIAARLVYKKQSRITGGRGSCPQCGKDLPLEPGPLSWPMEDMCSHCQTQVSVSLAETPSRS